MTNAPAGWYPDPEYPGQQRYWDGSAWTVNRAPGPSPVATAPTTAHSPGSTTATLGLVLAILGFVLGILPFATWFAWLVFVPALILAIRVLVRSEPGRGRSIAAIVLVGVGWLASLVVGLGSLAAILPEASSSPVAATTASPAPTGTASTTPAPTAASASPTPTPTPAAPGIGQAVTSGNGVSFTVTDEQCGLGSQDAAFGRTAPKGAFCAVDFTVTNGGSSPQTVAAYNLAGYIGGARYEPNTDLGTFGDDPFMTTVNPGLSVACTVYIDVPAGATLDRITLTTSWWGGDGATVRLR